jgi:hypothetical protein
MTKKVKIVEHWALDLCTTTAVEWGVGLVDHVLRKAYVPTGVTPMDCPWFLFLFFDWMKRLNERAQRLVQLVGFLTLAYEQMYFF